MTKALLAALFVSVTVVYAMDLSVMDDQPSVYKRACVDHNGCCGMLKPFCNYQWVKSICAKTCEGCRVIVKNCDPSHRDQNGCREWKVKGYCEKGLRHLKHMMKYCPIACGTCRRSSAITVRCLNAHNAKRALHGAAPLTWDQNIARGAQAYAVKLARARMLQPDSRIRGRYGENLYSASGNAKRSLECEKATIAWYKGAYIYHYGRNTYQHAAATFTQLVWKASKRLGVGIATIRGYTVVVARYAPPGNVHGHFRQNVGYPRG